MSYLDSEALKPLILIILIAIAIYTFIKKDLGNVATKDLSTTKKVIFGAVIGAVIGFYDGFFGPGTGSFFVLAFVVILGFDFLSASAYAKVVNCITVGTICQKNTLQLEGFAFNLAFFLPVFIFGS